jgi:hypothetical protein
MIRSRAWLAIGLAAAACGAPGPSPSITPTNAAVATAQATDRPSSSALALATPVPVATQPAPTAALPTPVICPGAQPFTVEQYAEIVHEEPGCFGPADVTIRGWIDEPPIVGFMPPIIEPGWLAYPPEPTLALWSGPPDSSECPDSDCAAMFVHIRPGSNVRFDLPARWVIVTGHSLDPAAATCQYEGIPTPTDEAPGDFTGCNVQFVITRVSDAP